MDYFKFGISILKSLKGDKNAMNLIITDIENYRTYTLRQYNYEVKRATDEFNFRKFLNEYTVAINVFNLHKSEKKTINRAIVLLWENVIYNKGGLK